MRNKFVYINVTLKNKRKDKENNVTNALKINIYL